jgi:6-phosphogluconolactonase
LQDEEERPPKESVTTSERVDLRALESFSVTPFSEISLHMHKHILKIMTRHLVNKLLLPLALLHIVLPAKAASHVYFGSNQSEGIYTAEFDAEIGSLTSISLAAEIASPGFLATHPNQQYLYSTTTGFEKPNTGAVAAFRIHDDGSLSLLNKQPTLGRGPCHVSIDATGQTLIVANYSSGNVSAFPICNDGTLAPASSTHQHTGSALDLKRQKEPHPHSAFMHPNNRYAYVPDLGIDKVMIYSLDPKRATLTLSGFADVPGGSQGPRHMKFSNDGMRAYVLNELSLSIATYSVNLKNGHLEHIDSLTVLTNGSATEGMSCAEIRIHPSEQWIYASIRDLDGQGRDVLSTFQRAADGSLKLIANTPAAVYFPRNFNIDPSGKWLIVGGQRSSTLAIFSINQDSGALTLKSTDIPFEGQPTCVEFLQ